MSVVHGASAYRAGRCSCLICRAASSTRKLREDLARAARLAEDPSLAPHGEWSTYVNWRCRCLECSAAAVVANRRYRAAAKARQGSPR